MCGSRKYPYPPHGTDWNFKGGGGSKAQGNPGGGVVSIYIIFSIMLNYLCLHFAYRSADANIDLVNCTKVIFSRWSGSISGAAIVRSFYQTAFISGRRAQNASSERNVQLRNFVIIITCICKILHQEVLHAWRK